MPSAQRRIDPGVAQQLLTEPHRFQFFQAVRVLEQVFQRQGVKAGQAVPMRVRFRNSLSLGFPATELAAEGEIYSLKGERLQDREAIEQALIGEELAEVHLTPQFMGLLGTTGALPLHYTETLQLRELYERDRTARAFLDIFSTRAVSLHYAAWKKHRLALQYELDRRERFLPLVLSLLGMGMSELRDRLHEGGGGEIFDQAVAYYAGAIRQRPVSAALMQRVLSDYFQVPLHLEQFVGAWYRVPAGQATRLGQANAVLGASALAGDRVWQRDLRLRLRIGPLRRQAFDDFLPGGSAAEALAKWLSLLTGGTLEYEVRLVLRAEDVQGSALGGSGGARLGWDSYLSSRP
ncbi:MAG: hypothetical protein GAK31_00011 [Stenotrophomonas maltophilia]|uniref:Type VI secretion system baseplate subunit TssG n=1 Tax=Stenotrophomonas maltophilia TaxID=40324 RepID=A0A7V8JMM7_STEMA|nr:MAG: hypothetical protein GAK31_00011 [Stenotrophomonas maltophilia]